jgi:serine/threonine protein kinase
VDDPSLAQTLQARLEAEPDLARTMVDRPGATIEPSRSPSSGAMAALEALRKLGATLGGRIDLHETLGEGGMGIVHLGTQATLGRHVAVKTLRKGAGGDDAVLRILREAWVTGTLEHPNVVPVHDVGVDADGAPVIVMKRIEGRSWSALMHDPAEIARRFGATDALEWNLRTLASVCNAVHFAHSRGILHRDLKPENVMIGEFGEVYVLDWGIAVSLKDDPSGRLPPVSQAKEIAGTPHYMAPEMLLGDPKLLSPRTDVYQLGAIFYEVPASRHTTRRPCRRC